MPTLQKEMQASSTFNFRYFTCLLDKGHINYGRYFCIMAEKGETSHGGLTEKLSLFFHAKKQEVNAYGR